LWAGWRGMTADVGRTHRPERSTSASLSFTCTAQGREHSDTLTAMHNLAQTLHAQGDLAKARKLQEKVLDIDRRVRGREHPRSLR